MMLLTEHIKKKKKDDAAYWETIVLNFYHFTSFLTDIDVL